MKKNILLLSINFLNSYKNFAPSIRNGSLYVLMMILVISCHSRVSPHHGMQIPEKNQIRLIEGKQNQGTWLSEDVIIDYRYKVGASALEISGFIDFSFHLKAMYTQLDEFNLLLHLIDTKNKIVGYKRIDQNVSAYPIEKATFNANIELLSEVKAISFSYSGVAAEYSEGGKNQHLFWNRPDEQ